MLDMKFLRENPELVKENIKKKFQDEKLPLVDEVIALDAANRAAITEASELRASRNALSKQIGMLMGQAKKDPSKLEEAEKIKATVKANADRLTELEKLEEEYEQRIHKIMLLIPNIIDPSVPIGPDDSCNVEVERFGEPKVPDFEIPYHTQIMESFDGVDMDAAGRVSGAGFYYLLGDIARLHEGVLAYARDFMIDKGFTFCIPPFMIHGNVVEGVMSQNDMDAMMYKIEGEDLYLIGTSEHSMVGRFIGEILPEESLPQTLTNKLAAVMREESQDPFAGILSHEEKVDLVPSNLELSALEMSLVTAMSRESVMKNYLSQVKDSYDYVLIDCMPSLGMITLNALTAADSVIIPVQAQYLPAKGMTQLLSTIAKVKKHTNPNLAIDGILLTLVDGRTNLAKSTVEALRENFGCRIRIYRTTIPVAVKAAEVSSKGKSIYAYEPSSTVSKAYTDFTKEVLADGRQKERLHASHEHTR